jgi:hypothetical protein
VRKAALNLVLTSDQLTGLQLRPERESGTAALAESLGAAWGAGPAPAHRLPAAAEPLALVDLRIGEHGLGRITGLDRRYVYQAGAQAPAARAG